MTEVLVALALMGSAGVMMLGMVSSGLRTGEQAAQMQAACRLGGRAMDRLQALGFASLQQLGEGPREIPLSRLMGAVAGAEPLVEDGLSYAARLDLRAIRPGMIRVVLSLRWERAAGPAGGRFDLVRLVIDRRHRRET